RRRTRLLSHPSLWLELLAVVLLAMLLSGMRLGVRGDHVHLVVVLDGTASMSGIGADRTQTAAELARSLVEDRVARLPRDAEVTVIVSGVRPEVLVGPRAARDLAAVGLAPYEPFATGHALDLSLELAEELGGAGARYLLVTDRPLSTEVRRFTVEAVGASAQNVAVRDARRLRTDVDQESVLADVMVFGRPTTAVLRVVSEPDGVELVQLELELDPARPRRVRVDVPAVDMALRVQVEAEGDGLVLDDAAVLPVAAVRTVSLASDLPPGTQRGLGLVRLVDAIQGLRFVEEGETATLRVTATPSQLAPGHHELVVRPIASAAGSELEAWLGPFLIERRQELARGLALDGVVWSSGPGAPPGAPFVLAEDRVLASVEDAGASLRVHLNLAPARSNLAVSPDWPVMVSNLVDAARARLPGLVDRVVPVGATIRFRGSNLDGDLELVAEDGTRIQGRGEGLVTFAAVKPGLHAITAGGRVLDRVGVRFVDPGESDLTGRASFSRPGEEPAAGPPSAAAGLPSGRAELRLLALLLLVVVAAHAAVLARRSGGASA
ncbi:MAG: VWA domain-containing protein, partial [Planctomycetota bacterium]|nr:VWA domain-containing protein [Planctomycetota bacterium]